MQPETSSKNNFVIVGIAAQPAATKEESGSNNVLIDYETTVPEDNQSEEVSHDIVQYGGSVPTDAELQVTQMFLKKTKRKVVTGMIRMKGSFFSFLARLPFQA